MISCFELRIGNYILVNKNLQRISTISDTTAFTVDTEGSDEQVVSEHSLEQVEPVPMTDDILKQCGFTFHQYFNFWQLITTGIRSEMDVDRDYDVIDFMRKPIIKKVSSLHQLQNIYFMLKGRELKVNEKTVSTE